MYVSIRIYVHVYVCVYMYICACVWILAPDPLKLELQVIINYWEPNPVPVRAQQVLLTTDHPSNL